MILNWLLMNPCFTLAFTISYDQELIRFSNKFHDKINLGFYDTLQDKHEWLWVFSFKHEFVMIVALHSYYMN